MADSIITDPKTGHRFKRNAMLCEHVHKAPHKSAGEKCGSNAKKGREYCGRHGGNIPVGAAHPNYKDGRTSNHYTPARLAGHIDQILDSPNEVLELNTHIARSEALSRDLLPRLDTGESGQGWKNLKKALDDFLASSSRATLARQRGEEIKEAQHEAEATRQFGVMQTLITQGAGDEVIRAEINKQESQTMTFKGQLFRQMVEHNQIVTTQEITVFMQRIAERMVARFIDRPGGKALIEELIRDYDDIFRESFAGTDLP